MRADAIYQTIRRDKIIAIVRGVERGKILKVAEALLQAGIKMLEVTCNTTNAAEMIELLADKMEGEMAIGAGTVITKGLCKQVLSAGAKYIIAPDVNPDVIRYCVKRDVAVLPGAATATEILTAKRLGAMVVKIFPAGVLGVEYIKQLRGPIDDVEFVAVGGIRPENVVEFMNVGCIAIGIGASAVRKEFVETCNWSAITQAAMCYVENIQKLGQEWKDDVK